MRRLFFILWFAAACESGGGDKPIHHSLDGFLAPYDMAMPSSTTSGGTTGGTTTSGTTSGGTTSGTTSGGTTSGTTSGGTTGGTTTGGTTSGTTTGGSSTGGTTGTAGSGLDPALDPPSGSGTPCTMPGYGGDPACAGSEICRFYNSMEGRCESGNGGHRDESCTASVDCDILFQCYQGICTGICHLGTTECGPIQNCIDVGYMGGTLGICLD